MDIVDKIAFIALGIVALIIVLYAIAGIAGV